MTTDPKMEKEHYCDTLFRAPSELSMTRLIQIADNYMGDTRSRAWKEIERRDEELQRLRGLLIELGKASLALDGHLIDRSAKPALDAVLAEARRLAQESKP